MKEPDDWGIDKLVKGGGVMIFNSGKDEKGSLMNYKDAVASFGEKEVERDMEVWWVVKSPEQKYRIMSAYLILNEEVR